MKTFAPRFALLGGTAAAALLAGSPAALAAPELQVNPVSGVQAGQTVTVTLTGLPPNLPTVAVGQCTPQITLPTDCHLGGSLMGSADAQGAWQPGDGGRDLVLVGAVGGTDCTAAPGACTIAVTSLTDPSRILASVPLRFGAQETPKPTAPVEITAAADSDEDSNTGLLIGIGAAVVAVAVVAAGLVLARRRG
ncbi:neocarzinostatin apoprotein domain-containing protein [Nocardia sp. IFM 10818]